MKGVLVSKVGGSYELAHTIERPTPGKNQILVKSLVTGINPVENFQQGGGILVSAWPIALGCDASGVVVEVGEGVTKFKNGDGVFGCTRLGEPGYGTFQEYFLMDEHLAFKRPKNVSVEQAATIGVGLLTASLGLISGTDIELASHKVEESKWVIVLGAAGSVGQYAVQLAKTCGFRVLGSCSPSNNKLVESVGAEATFNYKLSEEEQLEEIGRITGGHFSRVIDTSAAAAGTALAALAKYTDTESGGKWFATTDDWTPMEPKDGIKTYRITLGAIGKSGNEHDVTVNKDIQAFIPKLEKLLERGDIKPVAYEIVGTGFEGVSKGIEVLNSKTKAGGKKILVKLLDN